MNRLRGVVAAGRSLATSAVVGARRGEPPRLRQLDVDAFADVPGDGARDSEIDRLLRQADLADLQSHLGAGTTTAEQLTRHALARVLRDDGHLDAVIELNPRALDEARAADARRAAGDRSPLLGIPVTVKDNVQTAGPMHTSAGAEILAEHVAVEDAPVVTSLRRAGAVVLGKANLSELAGAVVRTPGFSAVGGQTRNPYGPSFTPGGSSSGSAVSVAAGLVPLSVGTETSGSLIAPAAFTGLVGVKPSRGLVDNGGVVPLVRHQDTPGPLARSVADAAALLDAMCDAPIGVDLSTASLDGVRVGVLGAAILAQRSTFEHTADNGTVLDRIRAGLRSAGAVVVDAEIADKAVTRFEAAFLTVVLGGLTHDTIGYLAGAGAPVSTLGDLHAYNLQRPTLRMPKGQFFVSLALARQVSRDAYETAAHAQRATAQRILDETFETTRAELLASMSNLHSSLYATAGYPALTVPLGLRANGMPTGVTFIGRQHADRALLGHAHAFEAATRLRVPSEPPGHPREV